MPTDLLLSLIAFAFVMSATPGPNTMLQLASGVNFGFRRTIPLMLGVTAGFVVLLAVVGAGLGAVILSSPTLALGLKIASILYLLWLAWRIATASGPSDASTVGRPMSFIEAALFQWINPKAWAIALGSVSSFTLPDRYATSVAVLLAVFAAVILPISAVWVGFGVGLRQVLGDPVRMRIFNWTMAALLVASLWPIAAELIAMPR